MSYQKTKLIQERNILLERKYILEQAPAPALTPTTGGTTSTTGGTQDKKFTKEDIDKALNCSRFQGVDKNPKYEKKEQNIDGKIYVYYLTEKKDMIFCKSEPK